MSLSAFATIQSLVLVKVSPVTDNGVSDACPAPFDRAVNSLCTVTCISVSV